MREGKTQGKKEVSHVKIKGQIHRGVEMKRLEKGGKEDEKACEGQQGFAF